MIPERGKLLRIVVGVWLPVAIVAGIWVYTTAKPSPFTPPLGVVINRFFTVWFGPGFITDVVPSLRNLLFGFLIALVVGVLGGVLLALLPVVELVVDPFLQFLRALPGIALLPMLLVMFGTGDFAKVALIAFGATWPILLNTVDGIRAIAPQVIDTARSYRVTRTNFFLRVILPGAFPQMSVGIRLSLSIALVLMVGSEYYGALQGIGAFVLNAKQAFRIADMWSGVILLGIIGYLLSVGYGLLEERVLRWRERI